MTGAIQSLAWTDQDTCYADTGANIEVTSVCEGSGREWQARVSELLAIRKYNQDWDGLGSDAPDISLVDGAISFLHDLKNRGFSPPSTVILAPNGGIIFIWQNQSEYVEAETTSIGCTEWMRKRDGRQTEHWTATWGSNGTERQRPY